MSEAETSGGSRGRVGPGIVPLALFVAVAAISFAAIFFRKAEPTHPLVKAGVRLVLSAVLLFPWTRMALRDGRLRGRVGRAALVAGALYGVHFGAWVWSLGLTSVAASVTLVTATPLLLAGVSLITGRDLPTGRVWLALPLALVGVAIIGGTDLGASPEALLGDALAVLGCAAMAAYLLVARSLGADLPVLGFAGVATAVGGALLLATAALLGVPPWPVSWESAGFLLLAALVPQLVGHNLLTWSLRHTRPTVVGLATVGEPVGATVLAWVWLGEAVPAWVAAGCVVTMAAVVLAVTSRTASRPRDQV